MSLYSAQLVATAREQLNHQLEEKAASDHSIQEDAHKTEKYNPYHYHQTIHQKCKHHGEDKESILHKKLHEKIDQAKQGGSEQDARGSPTRTFKRIIGEREEVGEEMKAWAKTVESNLKGEHKLSDKEMHEHHARLYKWLLFLEDLFHNYEGTLRTQTSLHALGQEEHRSVKLLEESQGLLSSPHMEHRNKDNHAVKLPHLVSKERMEFLQSRVSHLEKQLESSQASNRDITKRFKDLSASLAESQERNRSRIEATKKTEANIKALLNELEQFTSHLLTDLSDSEKMKAYPKIVESKLGLIRDFKKKVEANGQ